jgi:hypothetical protein
MEKGEDSSVRRLIDYDTGLSFMGIPFQTGALDTVAVEPSTIPSCRVIFAHIFIDPIFVLVCVRLFLTRLL